MNERRHGDDPAEGADDPAVYLPNDSQEEPTDDTGTADDTDVGIDDIGEALPGAGRMNEDPDDPNSSDPDLRPDGAAPLP